MRYRVVKQRVGWKPAGLKTWLAFAFLYAPALAVTADEWQVRPLLPGMKAGIGQVSGFTAAGSGYRGYRYEGADPFTADGQLQVRLGRSSPLFTMSALSGGILQPGDEQQATAIGYRTDPKKTDGWKMSFQYQDVDRDFAGAGALGFTEALVGQRQRDFSLGWRHGDLAFDVGRNRLVGADEGAGLRSEFFQGSAFGLTARREKLNIDAEARFDQALTSHLTGGQGYDLAKRKLGDARAGFTDLNSLAGLSDRFETAGFKQGDLHLQMHDRELTLGRATLRDRAESLSFGGLKVRRASRALDSGFASFKEVGYTHWRGLQGGREDEQAAELDLGYFGAGLTQTRRALNPKNLPGKGTITEALEQKLLIQPIKALSFTYRRVDEVSGSEKVWSEGDRGELSRSRDRRLALGLTLDQHKLTLSDRRFDKARTGYHAGGVEHGVAYQFGKRTKASFTESREAVAKEVKKETVGTVARAQKLSLETAFGLSALHERRTGDSELPRKHDRVAFERRFGQRWEVSLGYENWAEDGDPKVGLAGYQRVLAKPVPEATAYHWAVTARPGTTELASWYRSLYWEQPKKTAEFEVGPHLLTEQGVGVKQAVGGDFRLRGRWTRFERDKALDIERREVAIGLELDAIAALVPVAEVGYRELRNAAGDVRPLLFATAKLRPCGGLELAADMARVEKAGADAVAEEWRHAEAHAIELSATQKFGKNGSAQFSYLEVPLPPRRLSDEESTPQRAQEVTVQVATPANWLTPGLSFKGRYHTRREPGVTAELDSMLREQSAEMVWKPGAADELSATYTFSRALKGREHDALTRLALQYTHRFEFGELAVTGHVNEVFDPYLVDDGSERMRFGFTYNMPF